MPDGVAAFYLTCFLLGLLFVVVSAALGLAHDVTHIPGLHHAGIGHDLGGHAGGADAAHAASAGHGHVGSSADSSVGNDQPARSVPSASPFNLMTAMAFLCWFGGAGYILHVFFGWLLLFSLLGALAAGLLAGWMVFLFLAKVLLPGTAEPDPATYQVVGSLGRVSRAIPAEGSGEVVYTLGGARHSDGARSLDGVPISRDAEVVIAKYDHGIAYVQTWERYQELDSPSATPE